MYGKTQNDLMRTETVSRILKMGAEKGPIWKLFEHRNKERALKVDFF